MVAEHGRDFGMGALILAARWIAERNIGDPAGGAATGGGAGLSGTA
ncbi:hypothetical protein GCM10007904_17150 [Oharaeibacter diazotrophicus]|nr:hypothetical protein GCM10007904_17150 [Oharaeibacter diazotrophicus]